MYECEGTRVNMQGIKYKLPIKDVQSVLLRNCLQYWDCVGNFLVYLWTITQCVTFSLIKNVITSLRDLTVHKGRNKLGPRRCVRNSHDVGRSVASAIAVFQLLGLVVQLCVVITQTEPVCDIRNSSYWPTACRSLALISGTALISCMDTFTTEASVLLLLLLSSSSSSSPLCRVFILIFLGQTMSLGNTVLQLFCCYYSWCLYR